MRDLRGRVAVVTGAASGMGRAMAERFAAEGMKLVLADIEKPALERAVAELERASAEAIGVPTDVADVDQVRGLADRALERFGRVDLVCNNAGVAPLGPILETGLSDWRWLVDVNLMGVVHGIHVFAPLLIGRGEGHMVNTASAGGLIAAPGLGAYVATKHAVVGLSETLYLELAGTGVGLSLLCPGLVATNLFTSTRNRPADGGPRDYGDLQERALKMLSGMGQSPEEIAEHVLQAVLEDRFYILPTEAMKPLVEERFRLIASGENPPRDRIFGVGDA